MLDDVWEQFFNCISNYKQINQFSNKQICGANFLYIQTDLQQTEEGLKKLLIDCARTITEQFKLIYRVEFIRNENNNNFVFKHRFYVPNKKMFCCGNNCANCTRFRK